MTRDDVRNLKELLLRMRAEDPEFRVSGAGNHKYQLGATLTESRLQAFEQEHSITLPEDYRFFLKEAGDGGMIRSRARVMAINAGAGPGGGILPLEETVLGCDLSKPFPLTQSSTPQSIDGMEKWGDEEPFPGLLEICYRGGAEFSYLVVNGPDYGRVWEWAGYGEGDWPWSATGLTFDAWYQQWINKLTDIALPMLARERVVEQISVGMTKSQVVAICGGRWTRRGTGDKGGILRFEHLATEFLIDRNDVLVRIVRHRI